MGKKIYSWKNGLIALLCMLWGLEGSAQAIDITTDKSAYSASMKDSVIVTIQGKIIESGSIRNPKLELMLGSKKIDVRDSKYNIWNGNDNFIFDDAVNDGSILIVNTKLKIPTADFLDLGIITPTALFTAHIETFVSSSCEAPFQNCQDVCSNRWGNDKHITGCFQRCEEQKTTCLAAAKNNSISYTTRVLEGISKSSFTIIQESIPTPMVTLIDKSDGKRIDSVFNKVDNYDLLGVYYERKFSTGTKEIFNNNLSLNQYDILRSYKFYGLPTPAGSCYLPSDTSYCDLLFLSTKGDGSVNISADNNAKIEGYTFGVGTQSLTTLGTLTLPMDYAQSPVALRISNSRAGGCLPTGGLQLRTAMPYVYAIKSGTLLPDSFIENSCILRPKTGAIRLQNIIKDTNTIFRYRLMNGTVPESHLILDSINKNWNRFDIHEAQFAQDHIDEIMFNNLDTGAYTIVLLMEKNNMVSMSYYYAMVNLDETIKTPGIDSLHISPVSYDEADKKYLNDGSIRVVMKPSTGKASKYYKLYRKDNLLQAIDSVSRWSKPYVAKGLSRGEYLIKIYDNGCTCDESNAVMTSFVIDTLHYLYQFLDSTHQDISKNQAQDGKIGITLRGLKGNFYTELKNTTTQEMITGGVNKDAQDLESIIQVEPIKIVYDSLPKGNYALSIFPKYFMQARKPYTGYNFIIKEPDSIKITPEFQDISCKGGQNGMLKLNPAHKGYKYHWTFDMDSVYHDWYASNDGVAWHNLNIQDHIDNPRKGTYAVRISDKYGQSTWLENIYINEPDSLMIDTVIKRDIVCYGDKEAKIYVRDRGGNGDNTYYYKNANNINATWQTFDTGKTVFGIGDYQIKVRDKKGCEFLYDKTIHIYGPTFPLQFEIILDNYNGYHTSCYDKTVRVGLKISGGNGGTYKKYFYKIKGTNHRGNTFDHPVLGTDMIEYFEYTPTKTDDTVWFSNQGRNIVAGTYDIIVKDERGCMRTQSITLTQPSQSIVLEHIQRGNVLCYGGATGFLKVAARGGVSPYRYGLFSEADIKQYYSSGGQVSEVQLSANSVFENLKASTQYRAVAEDANGCRAVLFDTVLHDYPQAIMVNRSQKNISCKGGNDGEIKLVVTGGAGGYVYKWKNANSDSFRAVGLSAGVYEVEISDRLNCGHKKYIFQLSEPDALSIGLRSKPVCNGIGGEISVWGQGGTPPYKYQMLGGGNDNYVTHSLWSGIGSGTHYVEVQDGQGCRISDKISVEDRHFEPTNVDFLASTQVVAQTDTIYMVERNVPTPDSIAWKFEPQGRMLNKNWRTPQVYFPFEGTRTVTMIAYYGGCDFRVSKTLEIQTSDSVLRDESRRRGIISFNTFPNPSDGRFKVESKFERSYNPELSIYDVDGRLAYQKTWYNVSEISEDIFLQNIISGVYVVRLFVSDDYKISTIVIAP